MSISRGYNSIIRVWSDANFSAETYNMVYASVDSNAVINGVDVFLVATTQLQFNIRAISADTSNVYVVGSKADVSYGTATLSNYPNP